MPSSSYRVVAGPLFTPAHLALSPRYARVESAVAEMGTGLVVADGGKRIVAFHEMHLDAVERLAAVRARSVA